MICGNVFWYTVTVWLVVLCALSCAALLASERAKSRLGVWLFKPLAAAAFVGVALAGGPLASEYGRWILVGLCLSWLGDVLLIPNDRPQVFLMGIASFLLAHFAYGVAFGFAGFSTAGFALTSLFALPAGLLVLRWLGPHLQGVFRRAVPVYVVVIAAMLTLSGAAALATGRFDMLAGASMFAVSDVAVARDRFIQQSFRNGAWGLPLYFAAQIVLALSIAC